jgi:hypothetical protein
MGNDFKNYKKAYEDTKISKGADIRINETLSNLPSTKKTKRINIAAATVIFVFISSIFLGVMFPARANTIYNSILGYFTNDNSLNQNYDKYAKIINKSFTKNGVELTIDSVVSDSLGITFGYSLKTDKEIKGANLVITKVLINSKQVDFDGSSNFYKKINSREYVGYQNLKIEMLPEEFKLELMVTNVGDIKGEWNFKLNNSSTGTNKNTLFTSDDFEKVSTDGSLRVSKVVTTPLNTFIDLTYKSSELIKSDNKIQNAPVFILDQNNREVTVQNVNNTIVDAHTYHTEFYIKEYKGVLSELTIIPYKQGIISKELRKFEDDNEIYSLKTKTPFTINGGDLGSIIIKSIIETKDNIKINCSTDSIYGDILINSLGLGKDIKLDAAIAINNYNPIYFNKKTFDYLKTLTTFNNILLEFDKQPEMKKDKYCLVFSKYVKSIKIYKELGITIPLMNLK